MSNSIGPCPTELDTLDSNILGAGSRWFEAATGLIQRHQEACLDHNCTLQQERPLLHSHRGPLQPYPYVTLLSNSQLDVCPIGDGPPSVNIKPCGTSLSQRALCLIVSTPRESFGQRSMPQSQSMHTPHRIANAQNHDGQRSISKSNAETHNAHYNTFAHH